MARDRHSVVGHRRIAVEDHVRFDVRMLRAGHFIALARDEAAVVAHRGGSGDDFATVIGVV